MFTNFCALHWTANFVRLAYLLNGLDLSRDPRHRDRNLIWSFSWTSAVPFSCLACMLWYVIYCLYVIPIRFIETYLLIFYFIATGMSANVFDIGNWLNLDIFSCNFFRYKYAKGVNKYTHRIGLLDLKYCRHSYGFSPVQ